jgi:hypothetical protein
MPGGRQRYSWSPVEAKRAEAAALQPRNVAFAPFGRLDTLRQSPRLSPYVTVGGQTYREVDNGKANVQTPVDLLYTPAERAAQSEAVARALFQAEHSIGTIVSGIAGMAGAPPRMRDALLQAGGIVDEMAVGGALRPRTVRSGPPRAASEAPPLKRDALRFGGLKQDEPAPYISGTATKGILGTGSKADPNISPPGWRGNGRLYNEARGHLGAKRLGWSGDDARNLVTLTQKGVNSGHMSRFEGRIARMARNGEVVEYMTTPLYGPGSLAPAAIFMTAYGSRSGPSAILFDNPAGRRR